VAIARYYIPRMHGSRGASATVVTRSQPRQSVNGAATAGAAPGDGHPKRAKQRQ
jgi:hypothetical protein